MKKTSQTFLLLILFATTATAQEIPGIKKQPKWAMPFYFEDANGERDTVWVGYDPSAKSGQYAYDSIYNEWQKIDTSKFRVVLCRGCYSPFLTLPEDSAYKIHITPYTEPSIEVGFINGKMPVTMKWDNSRFYSDSLPYPDFSPRPRARANLNCSNSEPPFWYCYTGGSHPPLILTDYYAPEFFSTRVYRDSFYFDGSGNVEPDKAVNIFITIVPHNQPVGIKKMDHLYADVYPNPFTDVVHMEGIVGSYEITLQDITGRSIKMESILLQPGERHSINLSKLPQGVYLLSIKNSISHVSKKLIK